MGVADRARKRMPAQGDYLDKDDLIRRQDEPFGVGPIIYDERGGRFGPRWVLTIIPWYEGQDEPEGLLTFTANPTRNPFFEDLQAQFDENGDQPIGPLILVKGQSQSGYRYYTLDDWTESGPAGGPKGGTDAPMPAPARPSRPAASAPVQQEQTSPPAATPAEPKRRPGRPRKDASTASSSTTTPSDTPKSSSTLVPTTRSAAPPVAASREVDPTSAIPEAAHAQEISLPKMGKVECPDCHQPVEGRVLSDDKGRSFIIHTFCPILNKATVVEYTAA